MKEKIGEYIKHTNKANEILQELLREAEIFSEQNRELFNGEIIEIYDENKFICEGVIGGVKSIACSAFRHGGILTMEYYLDEGKFNYAWNTLLYEVFAKKRDGGISKNHAIHGSNFMAIEGKGKSYDYYIKRKL